MLSSNCRTKTLLYATPFIVTIKKGGMYAIPLVCSVIGLIMFHYAAFGCYTFTNFEITSIGYLFYPTETYYGFWSYLNDFQYCVPYPYYAEFTGSFKIGRFIGVVGAILTWAIIIVVIVGSFFQFSQPKLVFRVIGGCMALSSLFSVLLLVGLSAGYYLGPGGKVAVVSCVVWAGGAVSMFFGLNEHQRVPSTTQIASDDVPVVSDDVPVVSDTVAPITNTAKNTATIDDEPEVTVTDTGNEFEI